MATQLRLSHSLVSAGAVTALGVTRLAMGLPLFAAAAWVTWLALRRAGTGVSPQPDRPSPEAPAAP